MMWGYGANEPGMIAWMIISSVIWLVLVGVAVWALIRFVNGRSQTPSSSTPPMGSAGGPSAHDILRERYARGEIDAQTFQRMQAELDASSSNEAQRGVMAGTQ